MPSLRAPRVVAALRQSFAAVCVQDGFRLVQPTGESQQLSPQPDGGTELVMEAGGTPEIRNWVLSFGAGAEVLEPQSLRDEVAAQLAAASGLYSGERAL